MVLTLAKRLSKESKIRIVCGNWSKDDFPSSDSTIRRVNIFLLKRMLNITPLRWDLKVMMFLEYSIFDFLASRFVVNSSPVYALAGMALHIFKKAEIMGLKKILFATTLEIGFVWRLHKEEEKVVGRDYEWLNVHLKNKILKEYELADEIIVYSKLTYKTLLDSGIDESKLKYLMQKIDDDYFKRRTEKKDNKFRVLYVGRLTPQKGIHYLIKAFKELKLPNAELLLFGATPTSQLRKWVNGQIKNCDNIKIKCGDPRPAYEQASVLVHPSLNDNTGKTISEALAYGLPIVLTENTGSKELIEEGKNGYIIPIRSVEAIKEKIGYYHSISN